MGSRFTPRFIRAMASSRLLAFKLFVRSVTGRGTCVCNGMCLCVCLSVYVYVCVCTCMCEIECASMCVLLSE
jgi:hypothetical protein